MVTFNKQQFILIVLILSALVGCEEDIMSPPKSPPPVLVAAKDFDAEGIAIEPGGKTVLATDGSRKIWRFTLGTDEKIVVFDDPYTSFRPSGVVVEPGGKTVLATRLGNTVGEEVHTVVGNLIRVDTATGTYDVIVSDFRFGFMMAIGLALEDGGKTALIAEISQLTRVDLINGTKTTIATFGPGVLRDVAIESHGETAIVSQGTVGLWRVNLRTGTKHLVSDLAPFNPGNMEGGMAVEPSTGRAFVAHFTGGLWGLGAPQSKLLQVDLATGRVATISELDPLLAPLDDIVIEEGGRTALMAVSPGIYRVQLP